MKAVLITALWLVLLPVAHGKDYYIPFQKSPKGIVASVVLNSRACDMPQITGSGWLHYVLQLTGPTGVVTSGSGCWKHIGDKIYVLPEVAAFWVAPNRTGGNDYYRLDPKPCAFRVPGISFAGWRAGRGIGILRLPKNGFGNVGVVDNGPMCWRYHDNWFQEIDEPMVYSASQVRASPLP